MKGRRVMQIEDDGKYLNLTRFEGKLEEILKDSKTAWDKDGNLFTDRSEYIKSLPIDEHGFPIIDKDEFEKLSYQFEWELKFIEDMYQHGGLEAFDFPEFYYRIFRGRNCH